MVVVVNSMSCGDKSDDGRLVYDGSLSRVGFDDSFSALHFMINLVPRWG